MFRLLLLTILVCFQTRAYGAGCPKVVCYHTNWSQYRPGIGKFVPENIDPSFCTHINYAFAKLQGNRLKAYEWNDESTQWMKGMYDKFNEVKTKNPGVKTLLAVGGWNIGSYTFSQMVATAAGRSEFATSSVKFLRDHGFDGMDIDWEYPANRGSPAVDKIHYTELLRECRQAFDADTSGPTLLLTAAVGAGKPKIDTAYNIPEMSKLLDFINLMTYDLHGSWETHTGHNSPLYPHSTDTGADRYLDIDWAANYWVQKGAPKDKLVIGLATYGRSFTLSSPQNNGVGAPTKSKGLPGKYTREGGFLSYYEICEMQRNGGQVHRITDQGNVPYIVQNDQWIGYDDPTSLRLKVQYIKHNNFAGIMVWAIDLDDFKGTCGQGNYPLMHTIVSECAATTSGQLFTRPPEPTTTPVSTHQGQTTMGPPVTTTPSSRVHHENRFSCHAKADDFYASTTSCREYYICAGFTAFQVNCAEGLIFNPNTKNCDWPRNYKCTIGDSPTPKPATTHQPTMPSGQHTPPNTQAPVVHTSRGQGSHNTAQPTSQTIDIHNYCKTHGDGIHPDPTDCRYFLECASQRTYRLACAPGTVFYADINNCDYGNHC